MRYIFLLFFSLLFSIGGNAVSGQIPLASSLSESYYSPKYELRAVWLTTIGGIDWPHSYYSSTQREELRQMLDRLKRAGVNTVLFQTRIRATTVYPSQLEPWDGCLTGQPGRAPGYDPLRLCIDLCHERGMECHAWVVTIPVGKWNATGCQQLRQRYPKLIKRIDDDGYMDPEQELTATYLAQVCGEIVRNYDIDGIHLDYIRYPETWKMKVSRYEGRANITRIVRRINSVVKGLKPWVKMSCSPVGKHDDLARYRSGGWNARTAVCQDAQEWLREGIMDQLYPMMYFRGNHFYPFAIDWQENAYGRDIAGGLGIYFLDPAEGPWTLDIVEREMNVLRQLGLGHCYFRAKFLLDNIKGVYDFACRFDATPALVPPMNGVPGRPPQQPVQIGLKGGLLTWLPPTSPAQSPMYYNVYASEDYPVDISDARNIVATRITNTHATVNNIRMNYAVTAMDRYGRESVPAQLLVNAGPAYKPVEIAITDGRPVRIPDTSVGTQTSVLDADFIIIETLAGRQVAIRPYGKWVSVKGIPDGTYQLRTLGRKGRNHRVGFFSIKRH